MRCRGEVSAAMETSNLPARNAISNRPEPVGRGTERQKKRDALAVRSAALKVSRYEFKLTAWEIQRTLQHQLQLGRFLERNLLSQSRGDHVGGRCGSGGAHGRFLLILVHHARSRSHQR